MPQSVLTDISLLQFSESIYYNALDHLMEIQKMNIARPHFEEGIG